MDNEKKFFLDILSAYVNESKKIEINSALNWTVIYELSAIHCVQGIIYTMLKKLNINIDGEVYKKFERDFLLTAQQSLRQEIGMAQVIDALNKAKIKHVLFKGFVLRDYYPIKETRTMGDVDFLVNIKDREQTDSILKSIGFKYCEDESYALVWNYINEYVYLEVHTSIAYQMTFSGVDYAKYFSNIFENLTLRNKYTYEIQKEYHFLYLLVHLAKHFYHIGAGVRMFLDLSVYSRHFENNINWDFVKQEINALKLSEFASKVFHICNNFLGGHIPILDNCSFDKNDYKAVEYILEIGVFGHNRDEDNFYNLSFGTALSDKKGFDLYISRIKMLFRLIFPTSDTVLSVGQPKWQLPFAWVRRWYKILFKNKRLLKSQLSGVFKSSNSAEIHAEMLRQLGLKMK